MNLQSEGKKVPPKNKERGAPILELGENISSAAIQFLSSFFVYSTSML